MFDVLPKHQHVFNPGTLQLVAYTVAAGTIANAVAAGAILLISTTDCHISIADSPTAVITDLFLPAKTYLALECTGSNKVSAIRDTADGTLYVLGLN